MPENNVYTFTLTATDLAGNMTDQTMTVTVIAAGAGETTFDPSSNSSHITLSGGDLIATAGSGSGNGSDAFTATSHASGKFYAEFTWTASTGGGFDAVGIAGGTFAADTGAFLGGSTDDTVALYNDGNLYSGVGIAGTSGTGTWGSGGVICLAVDLTANLIWWRKNGGSWYGVGLTLGDPATGVNGADISGLAGSPFRMAIEAGGNGDSVTANFGGSAYAQTPPSGFGNW